MKYFTLRKLFCICIPFLLILNIEMQKINLYTLFSDMDKCKNTLVYSFVFVPIMEISVLIANYVIPAPDISSQKDNQNSNDRGHKTNDLLEYLLNSSYRAPITLKAIKNSLKYCFTSILKIADKVFTIATYPYFLPLAPEILLLTSLLFLYKPLLARSDIPLYLLC